MVESFATNQANSNVGETDLSLEVLSLSVLDMIYMTTATLIDDTT